MIDPKEGRQLHELVLKVMQNVPENSSHLIDKRRSLILRIDESEHLRPLNDRKAGKDCRAVTVAVKGD